MSGVRLGKTETMTSIYELETILERMSAGRGVACNGLAPPAKGLLVATLAERLSRPLVVVLDKASAAEEFYETLRFFMPEGAGAAPLLYFPPWETLPYEDTPPHPEVSGARLAALERLIDPPKKFVLVTTIEAAARRTIPREPLKKSILHVKKGSVIKLENLAEKLSSRGYRRVDLVEERGEFSIRGGIVDVYQGSGRYPIRIELFGDDVESIRLYNPETQRSMENIGSASLAPFREVFYEPRGREALIDRLDVMKGALGISESKAPAVKEAVTEGMFFNGMEKLLPAFYQETATLFDYLPKDAAFVIDENDRLEKHAQSFYELIENGRTDASERGEIAPRADLLFIPENELGEELSRRELLRLGELPIEEEQGETFIISASQAKRYGGDVAAFMGDLEKMRSEGYYALLVASTNGGVERLSRILKEGDLGARRLDEEGVRELIGHFTDAQPGLFEGDLFLTKGALASGFVIPSDKWAAFTDVEILGKVPKLRHRVKTRGKAFSVGVEDLASGDLVVHSSHGVGRYVGARQMVIGDTENEYLEIEYADKQRLFLPMYNIYLIKKYSGAGGVRPALDKMGGTTWKKTKARIKKSIMEMADHLLKLYAARKIESGISFSPDTAFHSEFADMFEYEETEGQLTAYADIAADMESEKPMDRLICGDVGYGKTEVAMRAAFKAVYDGKQAGVLVPTTLLAQQHYQTFEERFRSFPVRIDYLSRFRSRKEQKQVIEATAAGEVDILIGTHRLLQKDVRFKDLGLVVIDEEQRFGVRHKEKLKNLSRKVDVLTLTATPIPRTLHTAMVGIRDLSVIETPPPDRQSIRTKIAKFSDKVIREAVTREMDRGGQVFFVHNQVRSIHGIARYIKNLVPKAKVEVAHGQMAEKDLERVMTDFVNRKFDVLVCTTIIESGLDIPSANTIMINRADHFGLAQMYQLRGRVGRDRHRAFGYFLTPGPAALTDIARKRLKAIEELSELGSGFRLAARDMEIRGAGNLLGSEQSGHIDAVGFDMYCEMLEDAIRELKGEAVEKRFEVDVNISLNGRITPEYVPSLSQRIDLYNRLNDISGPKDVDDIESEMIDRFGPVPEDAEKLLVIARIKALCKALKVEKVDLVRDRVILAFDPSTSLSPDKLVTAAYEKGKKFRFISEASAELAITGEGWKERNESIREFLEVLLKSMG